MVSTEESKDLHRRMADVGERLMADNAMLSRSPGLARAVFGMGRDFPSQLSDRQMEAWVSRESERSARADNRANLTEAKRQDAELEDHAEDVWTRLLGDPIKGKIAAEGRR